MVDATFDVSWDYGGTDNNPGTVSEAVTNLRFRAADNNAQDTTDPTIVLASGTTYSYWKQIYLECTGNTSSHTMNNIKLYTDGTYGGDAGVTINVGNENPVRTSGPVTTGYDVADVITTMTGHTDITAVTDLFSYTVGAPRTVTTGEVGSAIDAVGETTNYLVLQAAVADTTVAVGVDPGTAETITFQYDEAA